MKMWEQVVILYNDGWSYADIADEIGSSVSYVKNSVNRAKKLHPHTITRICNPKGGRPKGPIVRFVREIEGEMPDLAALKVMNDQFLAALQEHHGRR